MSPSPLLCGVLKKESYHCFKPAFPMTSDRATDMWTLMERRRYDTHLHLITVANRSCLLVYYLVTFWVYRLTIRTYNFLKLV